MNEHLVILMNGYSFIGKKQKNQEEQTEGFRREAPDMKISG
jgi:hypothetical protein